MAIIREQGDEAKWYAAEKHADTSFVGSKAIFAAHFERGMDYYKKSEYFKARQSFARSKTARSPVFDASSRYYFLLNTLEEKQRTASPALKTFKKVPVTDENRVVLARELFEIGRVHEQLGNHDSAVYYHEWAFKAAPDTSRERSRFIYGYARSIISEDSDKADSLLELIVYNNDDFGADARRLLGFTGDALVDTVAELYLSGARLRAVGDYAYASRQFNKLVSIDSVSDYAPRSLYALGWMFENQVQSNDSAIRYYKMLIDKYPDSKYAKDIRYGLEYALAIQNGGPVDTLSGNQKEERGEPLPTEQAIPPQQMLNGGPGGLLQSPSGNGRSRLKPGVNLPVLPRGGVQGSMPPPVADPETKPEEKVDPPVEEDPPVSPGKKP
jgi:tetratricopeptide (TPR) repeat protein